MMIKLTQLRKMSIANVLFPRDVLQHMVVINYIIDGKSKNNGKSAIIMELLKCFFRLFVIQMIINEK